MCPILDCFRMAAQNNHPPSKKFFKYQAVPCNRAIQLVYSTTSSRHRIPDETGSRTICGLRIEF